MNKSKICLILDDNPTRLPYLVQVVCEIAFPQLTEICIALNAEEALKMLYMFDEWNVISLDHDLDVDCENVNNPNTGMRVAKFIKTNHIKYNSLLIHTLNDDKAKVMMELLKDTGNVYIRPCMDL